MGQDESDVSPAHTGPHSQQPVHQVHQWPVLWDGSKASPHDHQVTSSHLKLWHSWTVVGCCRYFIQYVLYYTIFIQQMIHFSCPEKSSFHFSSVVFQLLVCISCFLSTLSLVSVCISFCFPSPVIAQSALTCFTCVSLRCPPPGYISTSLPSVCCLLHVPAAHCGVFFFLFVFVLDWFL